ncbi:hypothetical protein GGF49_001247 [Coemansia sp. RSA 1853]|nr:hypothetical protein GGF49_001247 [Coemansia sp. RSA 1853]
MDAPGTFVCKHSVQGAKWNPAYDTQLQKYVANVNYLTSHAYAFARFILLHEIDKNDSVIYKNFGYSFFYDVFLFCAKRDGMQEAGVEAQVRRAAILSYRDEYKKLSGLTLRKYRSLSAVASYVAKSMVTDYKNNVMLRFGETWRRTINLKLDSKNKMGKLVKKLKSEGTSEEEIREQRQTQIWSPARHAKQVLCSRRPIATTAEEQTTIDFVTPVLKCYPALPLRRSWVYAHVPLNTEVLAQHIFEGEYRPVTDKQPAVSAGKPTRYTQEGYWEQVVDLKLKSFKDHPRHVFTGYVMTDGVSISVIPCAMAAPVLDVRQLPGDSVNGPTALSNPNINNGAQAEGVLEDNESMDGAQIINPVGNDLTKVNNNMNLHDNVLQNPNFNIAHDTQGGAVVGNNNDVYPGLGLGSSGIVFKRQAVNAPTAIDNPVVNNGAMREGSLDAGVSADGANVVNPVGNDVTQLNQNEEVSGNNFENPNWNQISNNNGPAMAGNGNIFVPVTNEAGAIQFDNGDLMNAALLAGAQGGVW